MIIPVQSKTNSLSIKVLIDIEEQKAAYLERNLPECDYLALHSQLSALEKVMQVLQQFF